MTPTSAIVHIPSTQAYFSHREFFWDDDATILLPKGKTARLSEAEIGMLKNAQTFYTFILIQPKGKEENQQATLLPLPLTQLAMSGIEMYAASFDLDTWRMMILQSKNRDRLKKLLQDGRCKLRIIHMDGNGLIRVEKIKRKTALYVMQSMGYLDLEKLLTSLLSKGCIDLRDLTSA